MGKGINCSISQPHEKRPGSTVQTGLRIYCADRTKTYRKEASGNFIPTAFFNLLLHPFRPCGIFILSIPDPGSISLLRGQDLKRTAVSNRPIFRRCHEKGIRIRRSPGHISPVQIHSSEKRRRKAHGREKRRFLYLYGEGRCFCRLHKRHGIWREKGGCAGGAGNCPRHLSCEKEERQKRRNTGKISGCGEEAVSGRNLLRAYGRESK